MKNKGELESERRNKNCERDSEENEMNMVSNVKK
jgi:hypothetical protein